MTTPTLGGWLVHVLREADGALSLEEALHVIMDSMKTYFPCQSVAVVLIDGDTGELRIKISRQLSYTFAKQFHREGPSPTAERVVLEQAPLLLNDLDPASETYREIKLEHAFSSAVLAPVVRNQRGIGYIFCDRANGSRFDEADLLHLQVLGLLVGSLMEKFELVQTSRKLSQTDDATGVLQYKAFVPALATELERAREHRYPLALAILSVGAFRTYVETYGIDEAHGLLAETAGVVKQHIRDMDLLARFGADEFILCLSGLTKEESLEKLQTLRRAVQTGVLGKGDAPIDMLAGMLTIDDAAALRLRLQDLLAALGKQLVAAKSGQGGGLAVGTVD
jgi:diguanylate cyclase (GGDEF)-like protein